MDPAMVVLPFWSPVDQWVELPLRQFVDPRGLIWPECTHLYGSAFLICRLVGSAVNLCVTFQSLAVPTCRLRTSADQYQQFEARDVAASHFLKYCCCEQQRRCGVTPLLIAVACSNCPSSEAKQRSVLQHIAPAPRVYAASALGRGVHCHCARSVSSDPSRSTLRLRHGCTHHQHPVMLCMPSCQKCTQQSFVEHIALAPQVYAA